MSEFTQSNESTKATEQFDLQYGMSFDVDIDELRDVVSALEDAEAYDVESDSDEQLADWVEVLKNLEDVVETARKEVFEDELNERVDTGSRVGSLRKHRNSRRYVESDEDVVDAIREAGGDPLDVVSVNVSDAAEQMDELGIDVSEYVNETEYEYFTRSE